MQKQQIKKDTKHSKSELDKLESKFKEVKKKTIRKVILKFSTCCGCGCMDVDVERMVPDDSNLQNGDRIHDLEDTDEII